MILWTILLSILPVSELRGGMSYAILNGMNPISAFFISVLSNIFIVFFIFFFLDFIHDSFMKLKFYRRIFGYFHERAKKKAENVKKNMLAIGYFALVLFVAIPLPVTGAWTGTLIAWILGLERKKSILAISLGVIISGIVVFTILRGIISFSA